MKKVYSLILVITLMFCLITSVSGTDTIQPLWDHTASVFASIDFDGTEGTFTASVIGDREVTDIYATAYLYYKDSSGNWIEVTPWGAVTNTSSLGMDRNFTGISGVEYKCDFTAYVYVGTDCEEITYTAYETCP